MNHLNGISEKEYIYAINASWALYKRLQAAFPLRFKDYITDSSFKGRLSYNQNNDRWYLIRLSCNIDWSGLKPSKPVDIIKPNPEVKESSKASRLFVNRGYYALL